MNMKRTLASSAFWMIFASALNNLSSTVVFIALARLLEPEQLGIVSFAAIFIQFSRVLVTAGIPDALIQRPEWDDSVASTAFWTNTGMATILCALFVFVGGPIGSAYYHGEFGLVLAVLSLSLLIEGLSAVHTAKLRRDFRYKTIATRSMVSNITAGVLGVVLAYAGWGVWALVISRLLLSASSSIILWRTSGWWPKFSYSFEHVRGFASFSVYTLGAQIVGQLNTQVISFVIGVFLGPAALAQYRVGGRALELIVNITIAPIQKTALSAFSRLNFDREAVGKAYARLTRLCSLIACPVFLGTSVVAPDFVRILFGPKWEVGGTVMAINGLVVAPAVLMYFFGPAIASVNKADLAFKYSIAAMVGSVVAAAVTVPFGAVAWVAAGQIARSYLALPVSLFLLRTGVGIPARTTISSILPAFIAAILMAAVLYGLKIAVLQDFGTLARLSMMVAAGPFLYLGFLLLFGRTYLKMNLVELKPLLPKKLRRGFLR